MSVATEISRLQTAKSDIKTAIEAKGVTVPSSAKIDTYDDYIAAIPSGASDGYIDNAGVEYVDLGLPSGTLWAKKNVGAATETDSGDLFCWGRISTSDTTDIFDYWPNITDRKLYDVITARGGEPCCLPSDGDELYYYSRYTPDRYDVIWSLVENYNNTGKKVIKVSSKTDSTKFIVFPVISESALGYSTTYYGPPIWSTYLVSRGSSTILILLLLPHLSIDQYPGLELMVSGNLLSTTKNINNSSSTKLYCRGIIRR